MVAEIQRYSEYLQKRNLYSCIIRDSKEKILQTHRNIFGKEEADTKAKIARNKWAQIIATSSEPQAANIAEVKDLIF